MIGWVTGTRLGFIAQNVQSEFPQLVSVGGTTTIRRADGSQEIVTNTLGIDYAGLIVPVIQAIKDIATITGTFRENLIAWLGDAQNGIQDLFAKNLHAENIYADHGYFSTLTASSTITGKTISTDELCVGTVCITQDQFMSVFGGSAHSQGGSAAAGAATVEPEKAIGAPAALPASSPPANADMETSTTPPTDVQPGAGDAVENAVILPEPANDKAASSTPAAANDNSPVPELQRRSSKDMRWHICIAPDDTDTPRIRCIFEPPSS